MKRFDVELGVTGRNVSLVLINSADGKIVGRAAWEDKRDLSDKVFAKLDSLLKKNKIALKDIGKVDFKCDSPYFSLPASERMKMENLDSSGKCGFTAWQTGEIIVKTINFALGK